MGHDKNKKNKKKNKTRNKDYMNLMISLGNVKNKSPLDREIEREKEKNRES